ncbi:hypothetical protein GLYMA_02G110900v4 [Glycine max]|uniref:Uncharacterized protein n=2 Tax=Glycine subgen. Soja TaxID=1462606 RepID=A0A0R0L2B7_SOYBN|nr:hypothetical protein JHK87_003657 [Glycine soja]KAG5062783.1 hypothetical protein JHK85_003966 [Glycine max]KAG5079730.1 hypothetical protein JHK86_003795 [Glycine max]KAH1059809.1 hypothetical protein GYH30_003683 [Glycine max]KRH70787.1 hypothetical protein GLYMA_02G110900v4 [Glycine max]
MTILTTNESGSFSISPSIHILWIMMAKPWIQRFSNHCKGSLFACTCWFLWRVHNVHVFEDKEWPEWYIINQIQTTIQVLNLDVQSSKPKHLIRVS